MLEGDRGKRAPKAATARMEPGTPPMPRDLDPDARAEWKRIVPTLAASGRLAKVDRAALIEYCRAWGACERAHRLLIAEGDILKTQTGYAYPHPAVAMAKSFAGIVRAYLSEFGLTPAARERLGIEARQAEVSTADDATERARAKWLG
jgi:P27 family predicted phage terminase small subunit